MEKPANSLRATVLRGFLNRSLHQRDLVHRCYCRRIQIHLDRSASSQEELVRDNFTLYQSAAPSTSLELQQLIVGSRHHGKRVVDVYSAGKRQHSIAPDDVVISVLGDVGR